MPTATSVAASPTPVPVNPTATPGTGTLSGYFVATNGNDANPGTQSQPWRTIGKASSTVTAGATVYVRGGVYAEQVNLSRSGTQSAPIRFLAYPGETPVIDASSVSMGTWSSLLNLSGNWIQVSGFEVSYSKYIGVELSGQHNLADNVFSHDSKETGILIRGDYNTVQNSRIWRSALNNENGVMSGGGWASGLSAARDNVDGKTEYAVMRNNTSWENWGEGVSSFEAGNITMVGNISHDNYSTNIYISDTDTALVKDNLVYMTPGSPLYGHGANVGIMMGDEVYKPPSANITVVNNIAYGNKRNFFWWQGDQGGGMVNTLIAYNTFVNSTYEAGVIINAGTHQNVRFENNITQQDGSLPVADIVTNSQVVISNNLWSKTPSGGAVGSGSIVGDPKLSKSGSPYSADYYRLLDGSPAIDKAKALSEVTTDFFEKPRGAAPDLGAIEK